MLAKLTISNYALIDQLEIDFSQGFSVITGETGAGKSILLGALSLLIGQRADSSILLDRSRKCIVEGIFNIKDYHLEDFFLANELDIDETVILRREIHQNGKSRAFINDTPVTLPVLKDLCDRLVNIHSQHSIITLNDTDFQLSVLDSYAGISSEVIEFREYYTDYLNQKKDLEELIQQEARSRNERDYIQFLYAELETAAIQMDEKEETEQRLDILSHAEEIKTNLLKALQILSGGEINIHGLLSELSAISSGISAFHPQIREISERIKSNQIDLKDINIEIAKIEQDVYFDPSEMELLSNRLDIIYRLLKKHNVSSVKDLKKIHDDLGLKLRDVGSLEDRINSGKIQLETVRNELKEKALKISKKRKNCIPGFEENVASLLSKLGMPDALLNVEASVTEELSRDGIDSVRFLFTANKGVEKNEISKIASGGELSRLMLTIKSLISEKNLLPTIIFDEIDSGVSGEIAGKVGTILKNMAKTMQVIVITHLPQIAGKGDTHYWVYKVNEKDTVKSCIRKLTRNERIHEIAKMLSNEKVSESAMKTAKELLN